MSAVHEAAHMAYCIPLVRERRRREGKSPAEWTMAAYKQQQRIRWYAKLTPQQQRNYV